jgi:hypothetical protein
MSNKKRETLCLLFLLPVIVFYYLASQFKTKSTLGFLTFFAMDVPATEIFSIRLTMH